MSTTIELRPATIDDLTLLQYWDTQPHVNSANPGEEWHWEYELTRDPDWREMLIAQLAGQPIGFVQIIDPAREESQYWGEVSGNLRAIDIWIGEAADLGKGYGSNIMTLAIQRCFNPPGVKAILIDPLASNTRAIRFYEKLGFTFLEQRTLAGHRCAVHRLDRDQYSPQLIVQ